MTAPTKKVWGLGDRAYVLVGSRVFVGRIDTISQGGHVHLQDGRGEGMWAPTKTLHTDRRALDVVALERQIREADKKLKAAEAVVTRAARAYFREVEQRDAVKKRLAAAKAKVGK